MYFLLFFLTAVRYRGVLKTLKDIYDEVFSENSKWLKNVDYFGKNSLSYIFDRVLDTSLCFDVSPRASSIL